MNKILLAVLIVAAIIMAILICYRLEMPFALSLVDGVKAKFTELTSGGLDAQTAISGLSIASAGASITGFITQAKKTKAAVSSAINESGLKTQALNQVTEIKAQLTETKEILTTQLNEVTQIKDQALEEAEAAKTQFSSFEETIKKQQQTIDTLHETLKRNKLSANEAIVRTVVT